MPPPTPGSGALGAHTRSSLLTPNLGPVAEESPAPDFDGLSDVADGGSSHVGSITGSNVNSVVTSHLSDSRRSVQTVGVVSAFTAPPRYRNSGVFVHATRFRNFEPIMEQGLRAGKSDIFMIDEVRPDGRVPGLRDPPEILIFIDEIKARSENMDFEYDAAQGTWKTKGINGVIRPWFFQKVVDQRRGPGRGNVLFQSKEDPMMQANVIKGKQRPHYLLHATYWQNVHNIMRDGILPAKNPTSELRRPFRELLQGAESHVYTVSMSSTCPKEDIPWIRRNSEPEVVPEEESDERMLRYKLEKDLVGLELPPDAFFVIDTQKADDLGLQLDMVQSADREDTIFVQGPVPPEVLAGAEANDPVNLPESLRAKIVDPRSFDEVPIIDLRLDEVTLVEQMRYACEVVGFMQVVGHGVPEELVQQHMAVQRRFFELPGGVKARLALDERSPVRGYFGRGGEDLDQVLTEKVDSAGKQEVKHKRQRDNKEALDTNGVPWSVPSGGYVARIFGQPSRFPEEEEIHGFREVLEEYAREMFRISCRLLELMALVLGRQKHFFEQHLTDPVATHRLLHYWPIKDFKSEIGVGEHTDYGLLTVLKQDSVGGLQVLNAKDLRWVHCCPVDGAFVVNLGDMMGRWTAHRFKSTIHRVVNVSPSDRYSVPYFLEPNMDSVISYGELSNGPPVTSSGGAHMRRCRLRRQWRQARECKSETAEEILERFYRASGQLKSAPPTTGA